MKRLLAVSLTCLLVAAGTSAQQAEKPAPLTREQQEQLKERDRLWTEAASRRLVLSLVGNDTEDGFLELSEVTGLKLNADLVVLSACRSGQGQLARGEGVSSLARAFLYAGSRAVLVRLWSVPDQDTAALMTDVYRGLQQGRPASDALRDAQLQMTRAGKPPRSWAPFILIGAREPGQQP